MNKKEQRERSQRLLEVMRPIFETLRTTEKGGIRKQEYAFFQRGMEYSKRLDYAKQYLPVAKLKLEFAAEAIKQLEEFVKNEAVVD